MRVYVLLIAHLLADFTLQTNEMASKKKTELKWLLKHCAIYAVVMAGGCFLCMDIKSACWMFAWLGLSHLLIDYVRTIYDNKHKETIKALGSLVIDQTLHIGVIVFLCWLQRNQKPSGYLLNFYDEATLDQPLRYILLFVTMMDPASILVRKISHVVSYKTVDEIVLDENRAGSMIGKLERLIIALLVINDGYGSIAFVLTAKSLARYDKLSKEKFADIYLVGTLSSTTIAMVLAELLG